MHQQYTLLERDKLTAYGNITFLPPSVIVSSVAPWLYNTISC